MISISSPSGFHHSCAAISSRSDAGQAFEVLDEIALIIEPRLVGDIGAAFAGVFKEVPCILDPGVKDDLQNGFSGVRFDQMRKAVGAESDDAGDSGEGKRLGMVLGDEVQCLADMAV